MILTRRAAPGLALCIALVTVTVAFFQGIGAAPLQFFGGDDAFLVAPPGGRLVGTATIPAGLAGPLDAHEDVEAASPEIFAPTVHLGKSVMARGVDFPRFFALEGAALVDGRLPSRHDEALAGAGFVDAFDARVGDRLTLSGAFARSGARVTIVGVFDAPGPARDELLLTLTAARGLTGVSDADVHLIRVRTNDTSAVKGLVESVAPRFTYSDVRLSATRFVPGEPVTVRANLTNWGRIESVKNVEVRLEERVVASKPYRVAPFATVGVEVDFRVPESGNFNVSVNPTFVVEVVESNLTFAEAPTNVVAGSRFEVRVVDRAGASVVGATLAAANVTATTDAEGRAALSLSRPGRVVLTATRGAEAGETAVAEVFVIDRAFAQRARVALASMSLPSLELGTTRPVEVLVEIENQGGVAGELSVPVVLNGTSTGNVSRVVANASAFLAPGERSRVSVSLGLLAPGAHNVSGPNGTLRQRFQVFEGDDPRIEALLRAYDERATNPRLAPTAGDSADDYVRKALGNIAAAVLILSLASGGLATLAAVAILARHVAERRQALGVLKALGAKDAYVVDVVTWEAARVGAVASAAGVAVGVLLAMGVDRLGVVRAFGHAVHPVLDWSILGLIFVLGAVVAVVAARAIVRAELGASADALLRRGDAARGSAGAPDLARVLEGA